MAGPKKTGIVASILYGLGLVLCSYDHIFPSFCVGFGLIGLARPGIQMPTLHLANLFKGSGGAVYMSAQAAAFDAGTAIFALFHTFYFTFGISSRIMFLCYLVVPIWTLATAILVWPNDVIEKELLPPSPTMDGDDDEDDDQASSIGSPYFSPGDRKRLVASERKRLSKQSSQIRNKSQVNAPLSVVLTHIAFYALATWVCKNSCLVIKSFCSASDALCHHLFPHFLLLLLSIYNRSVYTSTN